MSATGAHLAISRGASSLSDPTPGPRRDRGLGATPVPLRPGRLSAGREVAAPGLCACKIVRYVKQRVLAAEIAAGFRPTCCERRNKD